MNSNRMNIPSVPVAVLMLAGSAGASMDRPSVTAAPGMIWDADRPAVVIMAEPKIFKLGRSHRDELGVESLDPVTGKVRWRSTAA